MSIADDLQDRIRLGEFSVGLRIPPVTDLVKQYGVSPLTALRSVQELARREIVACKTPAKGTIVLRTEAPSVLARRRTLACLLRSYRPRNETDNVGIDMMDGIRAEISARRYRHIFHCLDEMDYERQMVELIDEGWISGVIVDQRVPDQTVRRLAAKGLPIVLFNRLLRVENLSVVTPDYEAVGRNSCRRLLERGYERLAILYPENRPMMQDGRFGHVLSIVSGFQSAVDACRIAPDRVMRIPHARQEEPDAPTDPCRLGLPARKGPAWRPIGVLATSDGLAKQLIGAIRSTDLELGKDIGVIGCNDLECNRMSERPFSTWRIDRHAVGVATVDELIARIENPDRGPTITKMTMEFVDRNSA